jgi:predicted transcriptional regulator of viral defense system
MAYMQVKPERTLDLKLDELPIQHLAHERLGRKINLRKAVERLKEAGHLHPLQAGRFAFTEAPASTAKLMDLDPVAGAILGRLGMPYYLSWHSALWHHGLVDQQSRRLLVAVPRRKRHASIGMHVVQFVYVSDDDKFFGGERDDGFEWPVVIARPEKAIIDSLDRPGLAAPVPIVADALRRGYDDGAIDPRRLVSDAMRFNSPHVNRRLGFFMDLFGLPGTEELALRIGRGYAIPLDARGTYEPTAKPPVNRRWQVFEDPGIVGTALELK